jgi:hypothetical protein
MAGLRIPLYGDREATGFHLELPALVELYNESIYEPVPYQYWRGRIWLEPSYRFTFAPSSRKLALTIGALIEHESDHITGTSGGYVYANSVAFRDELTVSLAGNYLTVANIIRAHFASCNQLPSTWAASTPGNTDAFESSLDVIFDGQLTPRTRWRYFGSLFGSWLLPHGGVRIERRLLFSTGFWIRTLKRGMFQFYGTLLVGNDVGFHRSTDDGIKGGGGFRWSF